MLNLLLEVEAELPGLLQDADGWSTKLIDYHPPKVERIYRQWRDVYRISLHRMHPCERHEALWHPHPWEGSFVIVAGSYEMGVGTAEHMVATMQLAAGTRYEMTDPDGRHYVRPLRHPVYTVMVTGPPREGSDAPQTKDYPFPELEPEVKSELLEFFWDFYSHKYTGWIWIRGDQDRGNHRPWCPFRGTIRDGKVDVWCLEGDWPGVLDLQTMILRVESPLGVSEYPSEVSTSNPHPPDPEPEPAPEPDPSEIPF